MSESGESVQAAVEHEHDHDHEPQEANHSKDTASCQSSDGTPASSTPGTPGSEKASSPSFKAQFRAFSKFGDSKSDGKHMTLSQSDKWMKQAKVIEAKKITTTDTGIYFKKFK
ncbi:hypothetical protein PR048_033513 [Dryococelus australis]|uniref:PEST proteolytic signal-containing nuclear protein n=1 Tax=Dryococelus australis TaxID=614101 RepID=A0ABQ9G0H2_9NEOP|nr:hypothetical protein PR048_033513 [Dryococelus australis]